MSQNIMDRYYRAAKLFASQVAEGDAERKVRELIARNGTDTEKLMSVHFDIKIDEQWIEKIEAALPHLEGAIREDRQFIKSEGNISPIERVRKVSRASVEHLARHSEMISHVPEDGGDLIPDKLKVYENESNFAVYENRVLYMVLCYTRDFLDYRFMKIAKARKECRAEMEFRKSVRTEGGPIQFAMKLSDGTIGLPDLDENNSEKIARIEAAAGEVSVLLSMPLMKEVALAPMVTPPITRTNVLRMDNHFKGVVELYDYLSSYTEDGFSIVRHENNMAPFPEEMQKEVAELVMFSRYLTAKYGREMSEELERNYQEEEARRAEELERAQAEMLREVDARIADGTATREDFIRALVQERSRREAGEERIEELSVETAAMRKAVKDAENYNSRLQQGIEQLRRDTLALRTQLADEQKAAEESRTKLGEELAAETERARALDARVIALLEEYGVKRCDEDMSEREEFLELEKERDAFERYLQRNWGIAKKKIRKRILWRKG